MVFINSISYFLPKKKVSNQEVITDYNRYVSTNELETEDGIFGKTGVKIRYQSDLSITAKDLGAYAAQQLFDRNSIDRSDIQALIFISDALDYKGPSTACILQSKLDLPKSILAFDILHGCTGWIYGLSLAKALIHSKQVDTVLVITADIPRRVIHPEDIELSALFSDGGAATLISNSPSGKDQNMTINDFDFGTDGKGRKYLYTERSASKDPADITWLSQFKDIPSGLIGGRLRMNSDKIFLFALRIVPLLTKNILRKHNLKLEDIDYFVYHQANGTMLEYLRKRMKIPKEKFIISIENIGNTVSSSIPIALYQLMQKTEIPRESKILVAGFGIGFSWGGTVLTLK
ncbi:MAG: ketoacyl-ACP synthase III [Saprospiraceae bacterium]|nr:ketoacyl-ACP synthase III [Saprospiraceae bacterium]